MSILAGEYQAVPNMFRKVTAGINNEWKRFLFVTLVWALFYGLVTYLSYLSDPRHLVKHEDNLLLHILREVLENSLTFYLLIYHIAVPLLRNRNLKRFFLLLALLFTVRFGFDYLLDYPPQYDETDASFFSTNPFISYLLQQVFVNSVILCISFGIALLMEWNEQNKQQEELEKQKADAELSAIKYQINPHFLFNSLSFIYGKTVILSEEVARAVMLLSDIMRYALGKEEDDNGKVALSREITHMKNVIEINQMRYDNTLHIQYHEHIDNPEARISPLVLITLVENAFKHGDLRDPQNPLTIALKADKTTLHFYICNKKNKGSKERSTGIGLNNVQRRLQLMYGVRHSFHVKEDSQYYITDLTINL